jgi:hypothetical protein
MRGFPSRGLLLGVDATNAMTQLTGHFPDSQDQRNTLRARFRYQLWPRLWLAGGADYGSGLPFDFDGTYAEALAEYGQSAVDRINFDRGRIKPSLAINASVGADVYKSERFTMRLQADGQNLNNRLNVIDFGGLFPGTRLRHREVIFCDSPPVSDAVCQRHSRLTARRCKVFCDNRRPSAELQQPSAPLCAVQAIFIVWLLFVNVLYYVQFGTCSSPALPAGCLPVDFRMRRSKLFSFSSLLPQRCVWVAPLRG